MQRQTDRFKERRERRDADALRVPGFYQVHVGSLVEIGDQTLDAQGRPRPVSLEQVGQQVTAGHVVLRIDRRRQG